MTQYSERVGPSNLSDPCEARWCYARVDGVPEPTSPAQAFGTGGHAILQAYFEGAANVGRRAYEILDQDILSKPGADAGEQALIKPHALAIRAKGWSSDPGKCALSGLDLLPHPDRCRHVHPEQEVALEPLRPGWRPIEGTRDLLVCAEPSEFERLGLADAYGLAGGWLVVDFKTSSDPARYAKSAADLYEDTQGVVYPLAAMRAVDVDRIPCAWMYFPSRAPYKGARRVDFVQDRAHAEDVHARVLAPRAQELVRLVRLRVSGHDATKNPLACPEYAGCKLHHERGGPCRVERDYRAEIAAQARKRMKQPSNGGNDQMTASKPLSFAERRAAGQRAAATATAPAPSKPEPTKGGTQAQYQQLKDMVIAGVPEAAVNAAVKAMFPTYDTFDALADVFEPVFEVTADEQPEAPAEEAPMQAVAETQGPAPTAGTGGRMRGKPGKSKGAAGPAPITDPRAIPLAQGADILQAIGTLVNDIKALTGCTAVELKF